MLREGCTCKDIEAAEAKLGVSLPQSLVQFLKATDGFFDRESQYEYAWRLERIVEENRRAWSDQSRTFDNHLLAFGGDGAGDWFCLSLYETEDSVHHWAWISAESRRVAPDLATFWSGWLQGSISV